MLEMDTNNSKTNGSITQWTHAYYCYHCLFLGHHNLLTENICICSCWCWNWNTMYIWIGIGVYSVGIHWRLVLLSNRELLSCNMGSVVVGYCFPPLKLHIGWTIRVHLVALTWCSGVERPGVFIYVDSSNSNTSLPTREMIVSRLCAFVIFLSLVFRSRVRKSKINKRRRRGTERLLNSNVES